MTRTDKQTCFALVKQRGSAATIAPQIGAKI
jgi:hypothetical protein